MAAKKTAVLGKIVPDFTLPSSAGEDFVLSGHRGGPVILYFYPKDNTPGCTLEGQEFNKLLASFKKLNATVLGVSRDSLKSHGKFIDQCGFRFDLLSDAEEEACGLFDVIREKNMYGKKVLGVERSTFLIDAEGRLAAEWRKVKAAGHAAEVLEKLKSLTKSK
ncbi:MAG: peroxiredoxin [Bdellovibrionaceae bacterium]|nr:peroxiredoxin [Pseudobdellovibrionaceae bacterium]MBX3034721.1 peroxiredoxin [Pseudobdellovibrionaceae bacterium]